MNFNLIFVVAVYFSLLCNNTVSVVIKEQNNIRRPRQGVSQNKPKCTDASMKLSNCSGQGGVKNTKKSEMHTLMAEMEKMSNTDCELDTKDFFYHWTLTDMNTNTLTKEEWTDKPSWKIPSYSNLLKWGKNEIFVGAVKQKKSKDYFGHATAKCIINLKVDDIEGKVKGGSEMVLPVAKSVSFDVSQSRNKNFKKPNQGLNVTWNCHYTKGKRGQIKHKYDTRFTAAITVSNGYVLKCDINIRMHSVDKIPQEFLEGVVTEVNLTQTVTFVDNASVIKIICRKNCPPESKVTLVKVPTILEATCVDYCTGVNDNSWNWELVNENFDYDENTLYGKFNKILSIKPDALSYDKKYQINVVLTGNLTGKGEMLLKTTKEPKISDCKSSPDTGVVAETKYSITSCNVVADFPIIKAQIYLQKSDLKEVLITHGVDLKKLTFVVTEVAKKVKVEVTDENNLSASQYVDITVVSNNLTSKSKDDARDYLEKKYFSNKTEKSVDHLMAAAEELSKLDNVTDKSGRPMEEKLLKSLSEVKVTTTQDAEQVAHISNQIVEKFKDNPDPAISKLSTELCEKSADVYLKNIKKEQYPGSLSDSVSHFAGMLTNCSESGTAENEEIITPVESATVSTDAPVQVDKSEISENYADYVDDTNTSKAMADFDLASQSVVNSCYLTAKVLAATMVPYEDTKRQRSGHYEITATKKFGEVMPDLEVEVQNVTLFPSTDFENAPSEVFEIYMCSAVRNPFWYMRHSMIFTSITFLQFADKNGERLEKFKDPFEMNFHTHQFKLNKLKLNAYEGPMPFETLNDITSTKELYDKVPMFCLHIPKNLDVVVRFKELNPDESIDVVITEFYKPPLEEFRKNIRKVTETDNQIFQVHNGDYDSWYYLSFLPSQDELRSGTYRFELFSYACVTWNGSTRDWDISCKILDSSTMDSINCECLHASIFAGTINQIDIQTQENQEFVFKLEYQSYELIYIVLAVLFGLYCVLFVFASMEDVKSFLDNVYFLTDVPYHFAFAYLLVVKTGYKKKAGTTSNVMIKLYGSESDSKEHVLNYPDPEKRLLQTGQENWFVLATPKYLGELQKIELWFDAIGNSPTWYLSHLTVYDMQSEKKWSFAAKQWFHLDQHSDAVSYVFEVSDQKNVKTKHISFKKRFSTIIHLEAFEGINPHLWNIMFQDEYLSKIKRLTIMYSSILTTFVIQLSFYGIPHLDNSDVLNYVNWYGFHGHLVWIVFAALCIVMLLHAPIVVCFRMVNKKYLDSTEKITSKTWEIYVEKICWVLLCLNIKLCMTILIIFGFFVPYVTTLLWITTILICLVVYVLLFENIFRAAMFKIFKKTKVEYRQKFTRMLDLVYKQRSMLYKKFGKASLRKYFDHLYVPLDEAKRRDRKNWAIAKQRIIGMLEDLVMIIVYVGLLYAVILTDRQTTDNIYSYKEMKEMVSGQHVRTMLVQNIQTITDVFTYLEETLIPTVHGLKWYEKFYYNYPGLMQDFNNKYLGIVRLRQNRIRNDTCALPKNMKFLNMSCRPDYSSYIKETKDFGPGWTSDIINFPTRMGYIWTYSSESITGISSERSYIALYSGGGYVSTLGRTRRNSQVNLEYILNNFWIDRYTRVVFIEFLVYNPNINLFLSVSVMVQLTASGYVTGSTRVQTAKLLFVKNELSVAKIAIFVAFFIVLIFVLLKICYKIGVNIKNFWKDVWLLVDILIIGLNIGVVIFYTQRPRLVKAFLDKLSEHNHNEFVNYFHLFTSEVVLTFLASILVFLATFRLCKLLKFVLIFKIVGKTLRDSAIPLLACFFCHMLLLIGFTLIFTLLLVDKSPNFKGIQETIVILLLLFAQLDRSFHINFLTKPLERSIYGLYMLSSLFLMNIYITIIMLNYRAATTYYSNESGDKVWKYLKEKCVYYRSFVKLRLAATRIRGGGGKEKEKFGVDNAAIPKSDEHRYAKVLTISSQKMKIMTLVAKCVLRSEARGTDRLNEKDFELMLTTVMSLLKREETTGEPEKFLVGRDFKRNTLKLVDDLKMYKMEDVVENLIRRDTDDIILKERNKFVKELLAERNKKWENIEKNLAIVSKAVSGINFY